MEMSGELSWKLVEDALAANKYKYLSHWCTSSERKFCRSLLNRFICFANRFFSGGAISTAIRS